MEEESLKYSLSRVKHEPPVEFVLILPKPSAIDWTAPKQEDVKPKRTPLVKLTKFDSKWPRMSKLFQTFFTCPHCQLIVKSQKYLTRHLKTCSKIKPARFICDFCGKKFSTKKSMRQHVLKHSSEREFCCAKCGSGFSRKSVLLTHSRSKAMHKCAVCDIKFSCRTLLVRHRSEFHGDVFKCDKCSYQTKIEGKLIRHKGTHDKSFACSTCGKKFATNRHLKDHQMQHRHGIYAMAPEETFDCDKCDKLFASSNYLKVHQSKVHDDKEVKCAVCGKTCKNQTSLSDHSRIHVKVECSVCHKSVARSSIARHIHSHSAKNLFKCDLCDHSTKAKVNLENHIKRMHLLRKLLNDFKIREDFSDFELLEKLQLKFGSLVTTSEKKFKCVKCNKSFVTPYDLNIHKTNVHSDKRFECQICKKVFKNKNTLKKHEIKIH